MKKSKLKKILYNYRFGIIFFIIMLIVSSVYNSLLVKSLFQVNIVFEKNNSFVHEKILNSDNYNEQIILYYAEAKNSFESSIFFKQNFDNDLIKMNKLCSKFKVNFRFNQYHKIQCVTENPKLIENKIYETFENLWRKLHKQQPLKNYSFLKEEEIDKLNFLKIIEKKTSPKKNKLKNIIKFNLLVLFVIFIYYLRSRLFKFS